MYTEITLSIHLSVRQSVDASLGKNVFICITALP